MFDAKKHVTYFIKVGEFLGGTGGGSLDFRLGKREPIVLESVSNGISDPISDLVAATPLVRRDLRAPVLEEVPLLMRKDKGPTPQAEGRQPSFQQRSLAPAAFRQSPGTSHHKAKPYLLQIFDGAENDDNDNLLGFLVAPPDTDGDVGRDHFVQMINDLTTIYDKNGNVVLGPFANNTFFKGLGGLCENTNRGDPIVIYDEETDRWLVSQFAFNSSSTAPWSLCIATSETDDPTGTYYQHEFSFTGIGFPDYPKYGFATDAVAVMVNLFNPFQGSGLGAIDKAELFSGDPATMVFFRPGTTEWGFVAGDNDGPVFDNMPPTFASNNGGSGDRIDFWEVHPDFGSPADSTAGEVASIKVPPFDSDLCTASREACIAQPGSGTGTFPDNITFLEAISDRLMHRLQLRNFGKKDKRAVVNHTVDADGNGKAGIRWYEFRNDNKHGHHRGRKDRGWTLFKEGTFSPDGDNRWMGSIAMNAKGDTCLGYSISSQNTFTSIGVAGRLGKSTHMNVGERVVFSGQNVQRRTARWGDYSAMTIDPVDGTCWYTQEYATPNTRIGEQFGWATKIMQISLKKGKK